MDMQDFHDMMVEEMLWPTLDQEDEMDHYAQRYHEVGRDDDYDYPLDLYQDGDFGDLVREQVYNEPAGSSHWLH